MLLIWLRIMVRINIIAISPCRCICAFFTQCMCGRPFAPCFSMLVSFHLTNSNLIAIPLNADRLLGMRQLPHSLVSFCSRLAYWSELCSWPASTGMNDPENSHEVSESSIPPWIALIIETSLNASAAPNLALGCFGWIPWIPAEGRFTSFYVRNIQCT